MSAVQFHLYGVLELAKWIDGDTKKISGFLIGGVGKEIDWEEARRSFLVWQKSPLQCGYKCQDSLKTEMHT